MTACRHTRSAILFVVCCCAAAATFVCSSSAADADPLNLLHNGSFERVTAPNLPDHWGPGGWGLSDERWIGSTVELWSRWRRDKTNPVHGNHCMRVDGIHRLYSATVTLGEGTVHTLSVHLRSATNPVPIRVRAFEYPGWAQALNEVADVEDDWKRFTFRLPPVRRPQILIVFTAESERVFWVDAVQIEKGEKATPYSEAVDRAGSEKYPKPLLVFPASFSKILPTVDGVLGENEWGAAEFVPLVLTGGGEPSEPDRNVGSYWQQCSLPGLPLL